MQCGLTLLLEKSTILQWTGSVSFHVNFKIPVVYSISQTFMAFLPCHIIIPLLILLFSCCWFVQWLWWKLSEAILVFEFSYFYCWAVKPALLLCSYNRRGCCDFSIQVSVILFATCNIFSCYFLCVYIIFRLFSLCLSCCTWSFPFYFLS